MHTKADKATASRSTRQRLAAQPGRAPRGPLSRLALAPPGSDAARQANAQALPALLAHAWRPGALPAAAAQALIGDPAPRHTEGALAQRAPTASGSEKRPELEAMADDPVVDAAIAADWKASKPNGSPKKEHGFWVLRSAKGVLSVQAFPSNGTNDSLVPGPMPTGAVAFFHTHPNTAAEGYAQEPSDADKDFATALDIPGLVMSHDGMFYFGPALKK